VILVLIIIPPLEVSLKNIDNATTNADLENKFRLTIAQIVGGIAVFVTLYFTGENLKIARETQMAESFTKSISQLKNKNEEIRLGAIYTLGNILDKYDETYWPIMEILTDFVRDKATNTTGLTKISLEVQTVLTVFGKRKDRQFKVSDSPDLGDTYLRKARLEKANFKGASFKGANLQEANLQEANFQEANLSGAHLEEAHLEKANFEKANFEQAHLKGTYLYEANLKNACLIRATLENADFRHAHLEGADLKGANLKDAYLIKADLENADLKNADLENADLEGANLIGAKITSNQLCKVKTFYGAKLDGKLRKELVAKCPNLFKKHDDYGSLLNKLFGFR
jgi:uncharacterized protein YjbI with pentapeptide repeats